MAVYQVNLVTMLNYYFNLPMLRMLPKFEDVMVRVSSGYYREGFLALQYYVDAALIEYISGTNSSIEEQFVTVGRMPYPPYLLDFFVLVLQNNFPVIIVLSFMLVALTIVREIVYEKEKRLKVRFLLFTVADQASLSIFAVMKLVRNGCVWCCRST